MLNVLHCLIYTVKPELYTTHVHSIVSIRHRMTIIVKKKNVGFITIGKSIWEFSFITFVYNMDDFYFLIFHLILYFREILILCVAGY